MLQVGDQAPVFESPDSEMEMVSSATLRGEKNIVLYFYPKDDTPGCTLEAQEFTDLIEDFEAADTVVFGVSKDSCASHAEFRDKYGLEVNLLADMDGEISEAYGVWREKEREGRKYMGILRSTFVIDKDGVIRHVQYDVKPKGHAREMLAVVEAL